MASNWTLVSDFSQTGSNFGKPTSVWDIGGSALVKTVLWKKGGSLPLKGIVHFHEIIFFCNGFMIFYVQNDQQRK